MLVATGHPRVSYINENDKLSLRELAQNLNIRLDSVKDLIKKKRYFQFLTIEDKQIKSKSNISINLKGKEFLRVYEEVKYHGKTTI